MLDCWKLLPPARQCATRLRIFRLANIWESDEHSDREPGFLDNQHRAEAQYAVMVISCSSGIRRDGIRAGQLPDRNARDT